MTSDLPFDPVPSSQVASDCNIVVVLGHKWRRLVAAHCGDDVTVVWQNDGRDCGDVSSRGRDVIDSTVEL